MLCFLSITATFLFVGVVILLFQPCLRKELLWMALTVARLVGQLATLFTALIPRVLVQGGSQEVVERDAMSWRCVCESAPDQATQSISQC
jgi:hypothetical protein